MTDKQEKSGQEKEHTPVRQEIDAPIRPDNANVILPASSKGKGLPPGICNIGHVTLEIPDELSQEIGFHVEDPSVLVKQFPQYKFFKMKEKVGIEVPADGVTRSIELGG